uniref:Putative serine proteinase inhibitor n=1 Tax=Aedes albopictus TaxID=7160 RepID=A0A1W7R7C6_AEDAL
MRVFIVIFFCIITTCTCTQNDFPFRGQRDTEFDLQLTKHLLASQTTNIVISPLTVKILLVLLYEATGDAARLSGIQTKRELRTVLEPNGDLNATRSKYSQWLNSALSTHNDYNLQIATKFFVEDYIDVIYKYRIISDHYYNATVDKVPFSEPKNAAQLINNWVEDKTHGCISELVTPDELEGAIITLINAVCFKGLWTYPFPEFTTILTFYGEQKQVQASFMEQNGPFYYDDSDALGAQLLRMPFQGGKFAMYFILPHQGKTVDDVLEKITPASLHLALWYMDETELNVTIPKFKFDFTEELNQPLKDIGIRKIFSQSAFLRVLTHAIDARSENLVPRVIQKTGININHLGSGVHGAAGAHRVNKIVGDETQIFTANRPFLFFIEDEDFGTLLIAGRVEDPTK